jgi:hypothetical protein
MQGTGDLRADGAAAFIRLNQSKLWLGGVTLLNGGQLSRLAITRSTSRLLRRSASLTNRAAIEKFCRRLGGWFGDRSASKYRLGRIFRLPGLIIALW